MFRPTPLIVITAIIIFLVALSAGSHSINIFTGDSTDLWLLGSIRLPRILIAALCGASLSCAGVISQGLFRNPLASPGIIGAASGAGFAVCLVFYLSPPGFHWWILPSASFLGAATVTALVFLILYYQKITSTDKLLLLGFAISSLFSALSALIMSLGTEDPHKFAAMLPYFLGGFGGKGYEHLWMILPLSIIGATLAVKISQPLNLLALGYDTAKSLGVDIRKLQMLSVLAIACLEGSSAAVGGSLPFVGLLVPHLTRKIVGPNYRRLLFCSAINGISLTVGADLLARTLRSPIDMEVGVFTSILGAIVFLFLVVYAKPLP